MFRRHKSELTPELIAQVTNKNLCQGCKHHILNGKQITCALTNDGPNHNGKCPNFQMKDERLITLMEIFREKAYKLRDGAQWWMEIGGMISVLLIVIICAQLRQFPNHYLAIALIILACLILAVSVWMYFDLHEQSHKLEISALEYFSKLNKGDNEIQVQADKRIKITPHLIKNHLERLGYAPQFFDDTIIFKYGELNMIIDYVDGILTMQLRFGISDEDKAQINELKQCCDEFMSSTRLIKALVFDDALVYVIDAHMKYMDEFESYFVRYAFWLSQANTRICERLEQLAPSAPSSNFIYSLAYRLIPSALTHLKNGKLSIEDLWNEELMRDTLRRHEQYVDEAELTKFRVLSVSDYGEIKQVVYQFPEPQIAPEAKYGAVLVNTRTLECQYYTLEMSDNDLWFYCGVNGQQHLNYGEAKSSDLESFLTWVLSQNKSIEAHSTIRSGSNKPSQPN